MLDLKSKLLAAGLVTEAQVEKAEREEEERRERKKLARAQRAQGGEPRGKSAKSKGRGPRGGRPREAGGPVDERADAARWKKRLEQLQAAGKAEQYDAVRAWVQRARLDAVKAIPSEEAERFHFARHDSGIASLMLEPDIKAQVLGGDAGISAYMSNNGLAHCVLPRAVALDVAALRPEWVRVLEGHDVVPNADEQRAKAYLEEGEAVAPEGGASATAEGAAPAAEATSKSAPEAPAPAAEAADPSTPHSAEA